MLASKQSACSAWGFALAFDMWLGCRTAGSVLPLDWPRPFDFEGSGLGVLLFLLGHGRCAAAPADARVLCGASEGGLSAGSLPNVPSFGPRRQVLGLDGDVQWFRTARSLLLQSH